MWRGAVFWVGFCILILAVLPFPVLPESSPNPDFKMGVHLLLLGRHTHFPREGWGEHLRYARQMTGPGGWVVQLVYGNDKNPAKWQHFLDACAELQLRPVLRLATVETPDYWAAPPADAASEWADFFAQLDIQQPVWVVVGNEPNNGSEWGGRANPAEYAQYFLAVASQLKALQKPIQIAPAALDLFLPHTNGLPFPGTDITMMDAAAFWDGMFAAQPNFMLYVDFWASHVYPLGAFHRPPWEQEFRFDRFQGAESIPIPYPPFQIYNRGINSYRWEQWYLESQFGVDMPPILITEYGYRHRESTNPLARDSGGAEVDSRTAAVYVEQAIFGHNTYGWTPLSRDPLLMGVVYFALAGTPDFWGHTNLLLVDNDGRVRETYPIYDMLVKYATP